MTQKLSQRMRGVGAGIAAPLLLMTCWGISEDAAARAIATVSAEAQFTVQAPGGGAVDVLAFITDDGTNPATTFAFVDPDGIAGSGAVATGSVSGIAANTLELSAAALAEASGTPEPMAEVAYAQTSLAAGFLLINQSATETADVTLTVVWSWAMDLAAAGSSVDLAIGQVFLDLVVDGVLTDQLVADFLLAPPEVGASTAASFPTVLSLAPFGLHEVTLNLLALGVAQAMVPNPTPAPGSLALVLAGMSAWMLLRTRGCR